jgi:hypothetical protein
MPYSIVNTAHIHVFMQQLNQHYQLPDGVSSRM